MWITVSASVTILTYSFLFQSTIRTTIRKSPQFFLNLNLRRMSAGAMRWSRILAFKILPDLFIFGVVVAVIVGIIVGMVELNVLNVSAAAKAGIVTGMIVIIVLFVSAFMFACVSKGKRRRASEPEIRVRSRGT